MSGILSSPPLALYVHLPWCLSKCPYCDFNSHAATEIPEERGLIERSRSTIRPTARGTNFLNDLLILFMGNDGAAPVEHGKRAPVDGGGGQLVL